MLPRYPVLFLLTMCAATACGQALQGSVPFGQIVDEKGQPIPGATVTLPLIGSNVQATSNASGGFVLFGAFGRTAPQRAIVHIEKAGFGSRALEFQRQAGTFLRVVLRTTKDEVVIDSGVYHLGDGNFSGQVNSRFQVNLAGAETTFVFQLQARQLRAHSIELVFEARGVQETNALLLNDESLGTTATSPASGELGSQTLKIDPEKLNEGSNSLTIRAVEYGPGDRDDFEITNLRLVLQEQDRTPPKLELQGDGDLNSTIAPGTWSVTIDADDGDGSGIAKLRAVLTDVSGGWPRVVLDQGGAVAGNPGSADLELYIEKLEQPGSYVLHVVAVDAQGNLAEEERRFVVKSGPDLRVSIHGPRRIVLTDPLLVFDGERRVRKAQIGVEVRNIGTVEVPAFDLRLESGSAASKSGRLDFEAFTVTRPSGETVRVAGTDTLRGAGMFEARDGKTRILQGQPMGDNALKPETAVHLRVLAGPDGISATHTAPILVRAYAATTPQPGSDILRANNEAKLILDVLPVHVGGRVMVDPGTNTFVPLQKVRVTVRAGMTTTTVHTDSKGWYLIPLPAMVPVNTRFEVEVTLVDKDRTVALYSMDFAQLDSIVSLTTKPLIVRDRLRLDRVGEQTVALARCDIVFDGHPSAGYADLSPSMSLRKRSCLRAAASFYREVRNALVYVREDLGYSLDHLLPLEVLLHLHLPKLKELDAQWKAMYCGTPVSMEDRTQMHSVQLPRSSFVVRRAFSRTKSGDLQTARHETGHHVHYDASLSGDDRLPVRAEKDKNWGGRKNDSTADSLLEGFADFFAALTGNSSVLTKGDLQKNQGHAKEAHAVSALLWDLFDGRDEPRDRIALGVTGLMKALEGKQINTVRDLYERLKKQGVGQKASHRLPVVTQLDELFALHGFYDDKDNDRTWDAPEEQAGWANAGLPTGPKNPTRRSELPPRGSALRLSALDSNGVAVAVAHYLLTVHGLEEHDTYSLQVAPDPGGVVVVEPNLAAQRLTVFPLLTGYQVEPYAISLQGYQKALETAQAADSLVFAAHTFRLTAAPIPGPSGVEARVLDAHTVRLAWRGEEQAIVVRGSRHAPTFIGDGALVYAGPDSVVVDAELVSASLYHYTVFSWTDDGFSIGATATAGPGWSPPPDYRPAPTPAPPAAPPDLEVASPWLAAAGLLAAVLVIALLSWWRLRKR